jgi:hypothetical protein
MRYKGRDLRQLYEIEIYTGDWENGETATRKVTALGVNAEDAMRRLGSSNRPAKYPKALHFVTWPEPGQDASEVYRIDDTSGPVGEKLDPDFSRFKKKAKKKKA